ncbi:hypothetical protein ACB092_11G201600, partial [Castanea dentata]
MKTPFVGTEPSKWLYDGFNNCKRSKLSKNFGILTEKLFLERSKCLRPLNDSKDEGTSHWKKFLLIARNSSFTQLLRVAGISPNNKFSEISKCSIFIKFPISMGMTP